MKTAIDDYGVNFQEDYINVLYGLAFIYYGNNCEEEACTLGSEAIARAKTSLSCKTLNAGYMIHINALRQIWLILEGSKALYGALGI